MSKREVEIPEGDPAEAPAGKPVPITSLVMADIAMILGNRVLQNVVERSFLDRREGGDAAHEVAESRSTVKTRASGAAAKIATLSVPGALIVGGGLLAKTLYDRGGRRKKARHAEDRTGKSESEE